MHFRIWIISLPWFTTGNSGSPKDLTPQTLNLHTANPMRSIHNKRVFLVVRIILKFWQSNSSKVNPVFNFTEIFRWPNTTSKSLPYLSVGSAWKVSLKKPLSLLFLLVISWMITASKLPESIPHCLVVYPLIKISYSSNPTLSVQES